ncbi:hypothetical protein [Lachnospira pectinoschiza]|uniref:Uncharacterized protein n=1 Tax=Lachnospira pectinoschiza TaxID=28052 RepID=A0A1G9UHR2_9FIRM|nr:hypothetical protein [Lachnospira pectinoschiza]SDM59075.1 hypothetical protein SAMN05216544_0757 [Lachnospira pectinoschiza]
MKKTYNLRYEDGNYIIEYSMPENSEGTLLIDEKNMELDSAKFYKMVFEKVSEEIEIVIVNLIDNDLDTRIVKKGARVCETLQSLCDDICNEINKKCFSA